jgi:UDP-3-O-[3-hydroxymyristoyl] glucosamine N-acyltransferase
MEIDAPFMKIASNVKLGQNVKFVGYANIYGCEIGDECMIGPFVEIQKRGQYRPLCKNTESFIYL